MNIEEFAQKQRDAQRRFGEYAKAVVEWAVYGGVEPDVHDYFNGRCLEGCQKCKSCERNADEN